MWSWDLSLPGRSLESFFFGSILTWPCQNTIFPIFSTYFGPKFHLNVVLGSKFARSESGIMFFSDPFWHGLVKTRFFRHFRPTLTYFGPKFRLNWKQSGSHLGAIWGRRPREALGGKMCQNHCVFLYFLAWPAVSSREFEGDPHRLR